MPPTNTPLPPTPTNTPIPPTPTNTPPPPTATPTGGAALVLYDNAFRNGFSDGSFSTVSKNACDTTTYTSASCSYAVATGPYGALSFRHAGVDTGPYARFEFTMRPNGQPLSNYAVAFYSTRGAWLGEVVLGQSRVVATLPNGWVRVAVPLSELNPGAALVGEIDISSTRSTQLAKVNFDDVRLVAP